MFVLCVGLLHELCMVLKTNLYYVMFAVGVSCLQFDVFVVFKRSVCINVYAFYGISLDCAYMCF